MEPTNVIQLERESPTKQQDSALRASPQRRPCSPVAVAVAVAAPPAMRCDDMIDPRLLQHADHSQSTQ